MLSCTPTTGVSEWGNQVASSLLSAWYDFTDSISVNSDEVTHLMPAYTDRHTGAPLCSHILTVPLPCSHLLTGKLYIQKHLPPRTVLSHTLPHIDIYPHTSASHTAHPSPVLPVTCTEALDAKRRG